MRKVNLTVFIGLFILSVATIAVAELTIEEKHFSLLYPVVRVNKGGSGTIIYSKPNAEGTFSTYVLTNHHVVRDMITVAEQWDSLLKKDVRIEKRAQVPVEIFKYKDLSTPIGTLKVDSEIVAYTTVEYGLDLALLKLELEQEVDHVAILLPEHKDVKIFSKLIAVGCSLGWPPLPSTGVLTRKNQKINENPYNMSEAQIIYGNSGGAMFLEETGEMIGIPARLPALGFGGSDPVTHMGYFIPIESVYEWLKEIEYFFIFDPTHTEEADLKALEEKQKAIEEGENK